MGELDFDPVIHHFSHDHPLELSNLQHQTPISASCSGCKSRALGLMYSCKTCNYFLHIPCSKMPQKITHPFHRDHPLTLFASPVYPEGLFRCDACGKQGNGFCFHCPVCQLDIHILCAAMPLSFAHMTHHHALTLSFRAPYKKNAFSCDICKELGSNQWLYRCDLCSFDAHLTCISENLQRNCVSGNSQMPLNKRSQKYHAQNSLGNGVVGHVVQGVVDGLANQAGQVLVQAVLGGSTSLSGDSGLDIASNVNTMLNN